MAQIVTITDAGRQLIAQAVSGRTIEFTGGGGSETSYTLEELKTASESDLIDVYGTIRSASASSSTTRITLELSNKGILRQYKLKTFTILAKLSGSNASPVPFAASSQDTGAITIDTEAAIGSVIKFTVPFNITLNGSSSQIVGTPGNYASIGDLDRFVSMHAPGNTRIGEDQDALGEKAFLNGILIMDKQGKTSLASFKALDESQSQVVGGIVFKEKTIIRNKDLEIKNGNLKIEGGTIYAPRIELLDSDNARYFYVKKDSSGRAYMNAETLRVGTNTTSFAGDVTIDGRSKFIGDATFQGVVSAASITITTGNFDVENGYVYSKEIRVHNDTSASASNTDTSSGIYSTPQTFSTSSGGEPKIISLNVGDYILMKRTNYFINTIMQSHTSDAVKPGTIFKISPSDPISNNAPYAASIFNGEFVDAYSAERGSSKMLLGAGTYMILTGFWKSDTERETPILIKKIGTYA